MKRKAIFPLVLTLCFIFSLFTSSLSVEASDIGKCSITITPKHSGNNGAQATGPCKGYITGYFVNDDVGIQYTLIGAYSGEVVNGQVIKDLRLPPPAGDYKSYELSVTTVAPKPVPKPDPKPEPKPEPKPDPKPKPKPVPKPKPKPKPDSKPNPKPDPKPDKPKEDSKGDSSGGNKGSNGSSGSSSGSDSKDLNIVKKDENRKTPEAEEAASWTVEEMKAKGATVEKRDGKLFAKVDGVNKEITEDEARKLGYKDEDGEAEESSEEDKLSLKKEDKEDNQDESTEDTEKEDEDKGSNAVPIAVATTVVAGATVGGLYVFHPSSKELINKLLKSFLNLFKK